MKRVCRYVVLYIQLSSELQSQVDWDARVSHMILTLISAEVITVEASSDIRQAVTSISRNIQNANSYRPTSVLRAATRVTLIRASCGIVPLQDLGEDYGLSEIYDGKVDVHVMQGTHESMVTDADNYTHLAHLLDTMLSSQITVWSQLDIRLQLSVW